MNNRRLLFGIVKIVCVLLLLAAMLFGYKGWQKQNGQKMQSQEAFSTELRPLTLRQRELELQLEALDKEYTRIVAGMATSQILAVDPGEWVEQKMYPAMKEAGMVGSVAMNLDAKPGEEEMLTPMQLQKLEAEGWQLIYAFDPSDFEARGVEIQKELKQWANKQKWKTGKEPLEKEKNEKEQELLCDAFKEWKQEVQDGLAELGIELDDIIYFKKDAYKREYDNALRAAGFDMIIHHGEEDRVIYADLSENKLWFPGAVPWNVSYPTKHLDEIVKLGANLVWSVSQPGNNEQEQFVSESFSAMLRALSEYRDKGTLEICTFRDMANFQSKAIVDSNARDNEQQKLAAQKELDEVNAQIEAVYAKYGMD